MRPTFGREYVENEFQRIADGLSDPLTVYLIGGGAMSLRGARRRISTWLSRMVTRTANCGLS
jgi:hypothetical protein